MKTLRVQRQTFPTECDAHDSRDANDLHNNNLINYSIIKSNNEQNLKKLHNN